MYFSGACSNSKATIVDGQEKTMKKKIANRESARRTRAKKNQHNKDLEARIKLLEEENDLLKEDCKKSKDIVKFHEYYARGILAHQNFLHNSLIASSIHNPLIASSTHRPLVAGPMQSPLGTSSSTHSPLVASPMQDSLPTSSMDSPRLPSWDEFLEGTPLNQEPLQNSFDLGDVWMNGFNDSDGMWNSFL